MNPAFAPWLLAFGQTTANQKLETPKSYKPKSKSHQPRRRGRLQSIKIWINQSHPSGGFFIGDKTMTKQQIIDAVVECAEKLGHTPSHVELMQHTQVSRKQIRWHFGAYARLLQASNLAGSGSGYKVELDELFRDWAGIARDLKKMPTIAEDKRTRQ